LIQLEQLRREREKLKIRISAPGHILRRGDLTARPVKRFQARAIAQKPALHRSINQQAFVSRAVGGGVATDLDRLLTRVLREIVDYRLNRLACEQPEAIRRLVELGLKVKK
jgi:hypothetical protein